MFGLLKRPKRRRLDITLYTRQNCCLCDEAKVLLFKHLADRLVHFVEVDVDSDDALRDRYGDVIPVIAIDGIERFRGRINEVLLERTLRGLG